MDGIQLNLFETLNNTLQRERIKEAIKEFMAENSPKRYRKPKAVKQGNYKEYPKVSCFHYEDID